MCPNIESAKTRESLREKDPYLKVNFRYLKLFVDELTGIFLLIKDLCTGSFHIENSFLFNVQGNFIFLMQFVVLLLYKILKLAFIC